MQLDRAITFAPAGKVIVDALSSLRKGGVVAINAIHLDQMPAFDYDKLLWGERQIRSVANMTRDDARDFLKVAGDLNIRPKTTVFSLDQAQRCDCCRSRRNRDGIGRRRGPEGELRSALQARQSNICPSALVCI